MPVTVTPTSGAADANSYISVAEADAYMATRLFVDSWNDADSDVKAAAVIWATRLLDALILWTGAAASDTQALAWPRSGMLTRNGFPIAIDAIPNELKSATAEFARQLNDADRTEDNDALRQGLAGLKVGPIEIDFRDSSKTIPLTDANVLRQWPEFGYLAAPVPDLVRQLLVPSWYARELLAPSLIFEVDR